MLDWDPSLYNDIVRVPYRGWRNGRESQAQHGQRYRISSQDNSCAPRQELI